MASASSWLTSSIALGNMIGWIMACSPSEPAASAPPATDDTANESEVPKKKVKKDASASAPDADVSDDAEADIATDASPPALKCDQSPHATGFTTRSVLGGKYVTYVPASYVKTKAVPVVVALHGAGDTANNFIKYEWQANADTLGWIVIAPEGSLIVSTGAGWDPIDEARILGAIDATYACYAALPKKTIIHGFSTGASMALSIALKHPNQFAGAAISSGSLDQAEKSFNGGKSLLPATRALPVSIFHGMSDPVTLFSAAQATKSALEAKGHTVLFHSFTGAHKTKPEDALVQANDLASYSAP